MMRDRKGFTLIELVLVMGIIAILFTAVLVAVDPASKFAAARNTQRRSNIHQLMTAVYQYMSDNSGSVPSGVDSTTRYITNYTTSTHYGVATSSSNTVDLCAALVTNGYMTVMPYDPVAANGAAGTGSSQCGGSYFTGYTISQDSTTKRITIEAPQTGAGSTELGATITLTN